MGSPLLHFFTDTRTIQTILRGPLADPLDLYAQRLREDSYTIGSARLQLSLLGDFNQWLERQHLTVKDLDAATADRYRRFYQRKRKWQKGHSGALRRFFQMIRPEETTGHPTLPTMQEVVLQQFQRYLEHERGLARATVINYLPFIRKFLSEHFVAGDIDLRQLSARDITIFVQHQAQQMTSKRTSLLVTALRSFFRHSLHCGAIDTDLAACVPAIASWSLSSVPKFLTADQAQKVLDWCDRRTATGRRNYAILLLLARLGLRAGEIVGLTLDDINWETGVITLCGKAQRVAQLPLPTEVGQAIAEYLFHARPRCTSRRLFIRQKAPLVGFANSIAICTLVNRALRKAGVESVRRGSHLFRHGLATQMLNQGASLSEIGELLRHRHPDTTAIYAKVDLLSLRTIALPWPGGSR
jgi:site-specific recombinase XerD